MKNVMPKNEANVLYTVTDRVAWITVNRPDS